MKNTFLLLLVTILLVVIANLLTSLGVLGRKSTSAEATVPTGSSPVFEYKALVAEQMDEIGFRAVAAEEGIPVSEKGEINFPKEMIDKISKVNLLPRTIVEVEKDGGWEFVAATEDNHYLFRRAK
ncbi:MAG: hypothetical protein KA152_01155 [Verrucomicrobiales bacterium]|nr:hypothetical protein [Verrucomicrobiales bacterium]